MTMPIFSFLRFAGACLLLCLLLATQPAAAWGKLGHAEIARIAEANLTSAARAKIQELLKDDLDANNKPSGRTTLPEIASWADEVRAAAMPGKYTGWHTRSNPVCIDKLGVCWLNRCADKNLLRNINLLKNKRANPRQRNEALKWVVHLTGDLHQPLHSGSNNDFTGNIAASFEGGRTSTLHWLWDYDLLDAALKEGPLNVSLENDAPLPLYPITVRMWMLETRDVSLKYVYTPLHGFRCGKDFAGPYILDKTYQERSTEIIRRQMERAGLRLAQLLNEILN